MGIFFMGILEGRKSPAIGGAWGGSVVCLRSAPRVIGRPFQRRTPATTASSIQYKHGRAPFPIRDLAQRRAYLSHTVPPYLVGSLPSDQWIPRMPSQLCCLRRRGTNVNAKMPTLTIKPTAGTTNVLEDGLTSKPVRTTALGSRGARLSNCSQFAPLPEPSFMAMTT